MPCRPSPWSADVSGLATAGTGRDLIPASTLTDVQRSVRQPVPSQLETSPSQQQSPAADTAKLAPAEQRVFADRFADVDIVTGALLLMATMHSDMNMFVSLHVAGRDVQSCHDWCSSIELHQPAADSAKLAPTEGGVYADRFAMLTSSQVHCC